MQYSEKVVLGGPVYDVAHLAGDALHPVPDGREGDRVDIPAGLLFANHRFSSL